MTWEAPMAGQRLAKADVVIRPAVGDITAAQLWRSKEAMAAGAAAARQGQALVVGVGGRFPHLHGAERGQRTWRSRMSHNDNSHNS